MRYKQCILKNKNIYLTSWIPIKFAKQGKVLLFEKYEGLWLVEQVGAEQEDPPDVRLMIKEHRKNTGDSLPRK